MRTRVKVSGMSCEHCVRRVSQALDGIPGVTDVKVDLDSGEAGFEQTEDVAMDDIVKAVDEAGYQVQR